MNGQLSRDGSKQGTKVQAHTKSHPILNSKVNELRIGEANGLQLEF
jgi:hypothetical protein